MTFDQLTKLKEAESFFLKDVEIVKVGDYVSIDNKLAFPVITSQCFERLNDISLHYEKGLNIGHIKFLKGQSIDDITGLPNEKLICFFIDYEGDEIIDKSYTFKNDFLIIEKNFSILTKSYTKELHLYGAVIFILMINQKLFLIKRIRQIQ